LLAAALAALAMGCYASHGEDEAGGEADVGDVRDGRDVSDVRDDAGWPELGCEERDCPDGMVPVPCGPFVMGSDPSEGAWIEHPEHVVWLSSFCIDRTEVPYGDYLECETAGRCPPMLDVCRGDSDQAANCLTRAAAAEFCRWAGKRLPTEAEWEKAARGGCEIVAPPACGPEDERTYPWGDAPPDCTLAYFTPPGFPDVMCRDDFPPVDSYPAGAGPYGAVNMAGNVSEWVQDGLVSWERYPDCPEPCVDPVSSDPAAPSIRRGGDQAVDAGMIRCAFRYFNDPAEPEHDGVRCAFSP